MTLHTRVIIDDPIDPREVFDYCRGLLGAEDARWEHHLGDPKWNPNPGYVNDPGQGYDAWLWIDYGADGPLHGRCECEPGISCGWCEQPAGFVEVHFDTAYAYVYGPGGGCGDLHADLIRKLGQWLAARGLHWHWYNEFNDDWHEGYEGLEGLAHG